MRVLAHHAPFAGKINADPISPTRARSKSGAAQMMYVGEIELRFRSSAASRYGVPLACRRWWNAGQ